MSRKNFDYQSATVEQIVAHFMTSTSQAIYAVRKTWKDDAEMTAKLNAALFMCKIAKIEKKFS